MGAEPIDPAVQAFEALRTEIAVLNAEITAALAEQRAHVAKPAPDYDLTLGRIAKQLAELTVRIAAVEGKPALDFTPRSFGRDLGAIVQDQGALATKRVLEAAETVKDRTRELDGAVGGVLSRSAWRWRMMGSASLGLMLGVVACFGAVAVFPAQAGGWIAATVLGGGPWDAGQVMLRQGNPAAFERMVRLYKACPADFPTALCETAMAVRTIAPVAPAPASAKPR